MRSDELSPSTSVDLRVRCGLALTEVGPILFILWWIPPVDSDGVPRFLKAHILNPMHKGTREVLNRLGTQKYLHVALIGAGPCILGLHELRTSTAFSIFTHLLKLLQNVDALEATILMLRVRRTSEILTSRIYYMGDTLTRP